MFICFIISSLDEKYIFIKHLHWELWWCWMLWYQHDDVIDWNQDSSTCKSMHIFLLLIISFNNHVWQLFICFACCCSHSNIITQSIEILIISNMRSFNHIVFECLYFCCIINHQCMTLIFFFIASCLQFFVHTYIFVQAYWFENS